ncbi:MAG TPA: D-amino-acid transaminase [Patescibacteria group bacterium]|nr:D-amino-acid transaminase [Patescibacteria group bacterium]
MKPIGLVDGQLVDLNENVVPMEDRGHQFGDGVYEVTKVYNGHCFALKQHLDRLFRSLKELRIPAAYTPEELAEFHGNLIKESGITEGSVYLQITRGVAPRVHSFPDKVVPRLTMAIRPANPAANQELWANGAKVITAPDERWLRCDIKSLNLLGNILAKQKAKEAHCFEALMVRDGVVSEGSSSNFAVVKDGVIWTHPVNNLILKGVTRTIVVEELAPALDISVLEKGFSPEFMKTAQEAFLMGTSTEIMPVVGIDKAVVGDGTVGEITRKIQQAYVAKINRECKR